VLVEDEVTVAVPGEVAVEVAITVPVAVTVAVTVAVAVAVAEAGTQDQTGHPLPFWPYTLVLPFGHSTAA
jgi:ABC-type amino acid transport system permease subunit